MNDRAVDVVETSIEDDAWALLERMVAVPSVTGDTDACARVLLDWAATHGLPHGTLETGAPWVSTTADPFQVPADMQHMLLFGHLDTVPGDIPVRTETRGDDVILHGRGTVDAKGCIAAFAGALLVAARSPDPPTVTLVAAVDEEGDSASAWEALRRFQGRPPTRLVVGEPSGADTVCLGYKGRAVVRMDTRAHAAHGGAPVPTAADRLLGALAEVRATFGVQRFPEEPESGWFDIVTAKVLEVDVVNDGLTDHASARIDVRIPSTSDVDQVVESFRAIAGHANVDVTIDEALPGVEVRRKDPVVRLLRSAILRRNGKPARLVRKTGTADLNVLLPEWPDVEAAVYGPGDSRLDHGPNEHLARSEFRAALDVLVDTLVPIHEAATARTSE